MPSLQQMSQMRDRMFSKADADGSGKLDFKEFQNAIQDSPLAKLSGGISEADARQAFDKLDTEHTGQVSRQQLDAGSDQLMAQFRSTVSAFDGGPSSDAGGRHGATEAGTDAQNLVQQLLNQLQSSYTSSAKSASGASQLSVLA